MRIRCYRGKTDYSFAAEPEEEHLFPNKS